uniref:Uncharacterized protein n=1 Tax=Globodera rostochiensis TaxID=31243 RepID=A0A914HJV7_GLORO
MLTAIRSRIGIKGVPSAADAVEASFLPPAKRHFRETIEWRNKKKRIIAKIRAMGRFNLAFIISRMPVGKSLEDWTNIGRKSLIN